MVSNKMQLSFRNETYIPSVIQIRHKGFKGVLACNPQLPHGAIQIQYRQSMNKFRCNDDRFCVVDYSRPYTYAKLNEQIIILLSGLGVTDEALLKKQKDHFILIRNITTNAELAFSFLCANNEIDLAKKLVEEGMSEEVVRELRILQLKELQASIKEAGKLKLRILIPQSRRLFGISDPTGDLKEVH